MKKAYKKIVKCRLCKNQTKKETKSLILPNCVTGLTGITLSLIGAYFYDIKGILFASFINVIFRYIWFYSLSRQQYKNL